MKRGLPFELFLGLGGTEYPFLIAHIGRGRKFEKAHEAARQSAHAASPDATG